MLRNVRSSGSRLTFKLFSIRNATSSRWIPGLRVYTRSAPVLSTMWRHRSHLPSDYALTLNSLRKQICASHILISSLPQALRGTYTHIRTQILAHNRHATTILLSHNLAHLPRLVHLLLATVILHIRTAFADLRTQLLYLLARTLCLPLRHISTLSFLTLSPPPITLHRIITMILHLTIIHCHRDLHLICLLLSL